MEERKLSGNPREAVRSLGSRGRKAREKSKRMVLSKSWEKRRER